MIDCRFVPVSDWPGKKQSQYAQKKTPYRAGYQDTLDHLERELNHLKAKDILVQAYFALKDIRNDGWPKSSARPKESGVVLTFVGKDGKTISMPCDTYRDWEANLRAIAFTLEDLRAINRRGVSQSGEQYRGWQQLPPKTTAPAEMNAAEAAEYLVREAGFGDASAALRLHVEACLLVRNALLRAHPDKGGTSDRFRLVQSARAALAKHHGVAI
ncbi:MAG: hypothetical protein ABIY63_13245 [Fibrobacteria bacterium]